MLYITLMKMLLITPPLHTVTPRDDAGQATLVTSLAASQAEVAAGCCCHMYTLRYIATILLRITKAGLKVDDYARELSDITHERYAVMVDAG